MRHRVARGNAPIQGGRLALVLQVQRLGVIDLIQLAVFDQAAYGVNLAHVVGLGHARRGQADGGGGAGGVRRVPGGVVHLAFEDQRRQPGPAIVLRRRPGAGRRGQGGFGQQPFTQFIVQQQGHPAPLLPRGLDGRQRGGDVGGGARLDPGAKALEPKRAAGQPVFKTTIHACYRA
ncbi:hypothetical protein D3C71_1426120 [compost metagenome]